MGEERQGSVTKIEFYGSSMSIREKNSHLKILGHLLAIFIYKHMQDKRREREKIQESVCSRTEACGGNGGIYNQDGNNDLKLLKV